MEERYREYIFIITYTIAFILCGGLEHDNPSLLYLVSYGSAISLYLLTRIAASYFNKVGEWYDSKLTEYMSRDRKGEL